MGVEGKNESPADVPEAIGSKVFGILSYMRNTFFGITDRKSRALKKITVPDPAQQLSMDASVSFVTNLLKGDSNVEAVLPPKKIEAILSQLLQKRDEQGGGFGHINMLNAVEEIVENNFDPDAVTKNASEMPYDRLLDELADTNLSDVKKVIAIGEGDLGPIINKEPRIGRNEPCSCKSGKKFKNCCKDRTPEEREAEKEKNKEKSK